VCLEKTALLMEIARALYNESFDHGLPHVERVLKWARRIVKYENIDLDVDVLTLTVYLHDVGRFIGNPHAYYSALIAEELLNEIKCPENLKTRILNAINAHSFSYARISRNGPQSDLEKVLSDADKLDALGIVGFLRVFIYGERERRDIVYSIRHFHEKIFRLRHLLYYRYSRKVAEKLTARTAKALNMLVKELGTKHI